MVIFHSYVSLPEGSSLIFTAINLHLFAVNPAFSLSLIPNNPQAHLLHMGVPKIGVPHLSSMFIRFSMINHPFGVSPFMETTIYSQLVIGIGIPHIPRSWSIIIPNILGSIILYNHQPTRFLKYLRLSIIKVFCSERLANLGAGWHRVTLHDVTRARQTDDRCFGGKNVFFYTKKWRNQDMR